MNSPIEHYVNYAGEETKGEEEADWEIADRVSLPLKE